MAEWVQKGNLKGPQGDPGQDAQLPAGGTEGQVLTKTSGGEAWADVPQPVSVPVPVSQGGTGATDAATARTNLGVTPASIGAAAASHTHSAADVTSGTLPVARGGTGVTTEGAVAQMVFAHAPEASPTQAGVVKTLSDEDFCAYMGIEYNPDDWS